VRERRASQAVVMSFAASKKFAGSGTIWPARSASGPVTATTPETPRAEVASTTASCEASRSFAATWMLPPFPSAAVATIRLRFSTAIPGDGRPNAGTWMSPPLPMPVSTCVSMLVSLA
jgi:hypothetical protein